MKENSNEFSFDFTPIGQAIKRAREARGITREQLVGGLRYNRQSWHWNCTASHYRRCHRCG